MSAYATIETDYQNGWWDRHEGKGQNPPVHRARRRAYLRGWGHREQGN